ncbi:MAG: 16S rRNA (adenine(1518)-N(6)/adenine(1519)-N(6))-dimethyltransferase RsmA [Patescibacteria group bacterium]
MKLQPKKSLGQHFLNSKHVLEQIISAANIQKGENVLEIGPGTGVLTRALLTAGANVVAIEKDRRTIDMVEQDFFNEIKDGKLKIIYGDILDPNILEKLGLDLNTKSREIRPQFFSSYSIVANIPYYITGAILEKFLEHEPRPNRMIILAQKEVAERIVARNGKESVLSISVKAFGTPKIIANVPPGAFTPPPTVDSAILSISDISDAQFVTKNPDITTFFKVLKAGFAHKRKFAVRNLETVVTKEKLEDAWKKIGLDLKIRAENITTSQWLEIVKLI